MNSGDPRKPIVVPSDTSLASHTFTETLLQSVNVQQIKKFQKTFVFYCLRTGFLRWFFKFFWIKIFLNEVCYRHLALGVSKKILHHFLSHGDVAMQVYNQKKYMCKPQFFKN